MDHWRTKHTVLVLVAGMVLVVVVGGLLAYRAVSTDQGRRLEVRMSAAAQETQEGGRCVPSRAYLVPGSTTAVLLNVNDTVVATAQVIEDGASNDDELGRRCQVKIVFDAVPESPFYEVALGDRKFGPYSFEQLEAAGWQVEERR
jgi:hypothetical protein